MDSLGTHSPEQSGRPRLASGACLWRSTSPRSWFPGALFLLVSSLAILPCSTPLVAGETPPLAQARSELKWRPGQPAATISLDGAKRIKRAALWDEKEKEQGQQQQPPQQSQPALELLVPPALRGAAQPPLPGLRNGLPPVEGDDLPSLEEQMAMAPPQRLADCPSPLELKKILEIGVDIAPAQGELPLFCPLGDVPFVPRHFGPTVFTWKASALCHKPLYFEETALERYGHTWGEEAQPLVSAAQFFGSVVVLPYKMGVHAPWECIYALGYYEPGSCAPYMIEPVPLNIRGALLQAGAVTGGVLLFP